MMRTPSGDKEAKTVRGSTSAGILTKQKTSVSWCSFVFNRHFINTHKQPDVFSAQTMKTQHLQTPPLRVKWKPSQVLIKNVQAKIYSNYWDSVGSFLGSVFSSFEQQLISCQALFLCTSCWISWHFPCWKSHVFSTAQRDNWLLKRAGTYEVLMESQTQLQNVQILSILFKLCTHKLGTTLLQNLAHLTVEWKIHADTHTQAHTLPKSALWQTVWPNMGIVGFLCEQPSVTGS